MNLDQKSLLVGWQKLSPFMVVHNKAQYQRAADTLDTLLDTVGEDQSHPLYDLLDTLGTVIHAYEEKHHPMPDVAGADMLAWLMGEHGLTQSDLPEIGTQGVLSEILSGKRDLNVRQIKMLAVRFNVSAAVFF